jgi:hypothetical protein
MINIPHIDLKIWNPELRAIEIAAELQKHNRAEISIEKIPEVAPKTRPSKNSRKG